MQVNELTHSNQAANNASLIQAINENRGKYNNGRTNAAGSATHLSARVALGLSQHRELWCSVEFDSEVEHLHAHTPQTHTHARANMQHSSQSQSRLGTSKHTPTYAFETQSNDTRTCSFTGRGSLTMLRTHSRRKSGVSSPTKGANSDTIHTMALYA